MMTKRKKIFIFVGIIAGVLIAAGLLFYIFVLQSDNQMNNNQQDQSQQTEQTQQQNQNNDQVQEVETSSASNSDQNQQQAEPITSRERSRQIAVTFVERFGSYSSQNENQHIESVVPMVTDDMAEWVRSQVTEQKSDYEGSTTVVVVSNVTTYEEGDSATVEIQAQQTLENLGDSNQVQKNGRVELVREEGQWKVDGLYWNN